MIDIRNLSFCYGQDFSLEIESLHLPERGTVSLIGPNGSGKTTLLRIISGLLAGYSGEVCLNGRGIVHMSREELAAKTAYVPVYARPDYPVSVRELILSGSYRFGGDADVSEQSRLCGVDHMLDKSVYTLSSGEMKRVLIARALVQDTDVVVMDEPFANLDPKYELRVMGIIREIAKQKLVIAAVHNISIASVMSDFIAGLRGGHLFFSGEKIPDTEILKELYGSEFISVGGHPCPDYFGLV